MSFEHIFEGVIILHNVWDWLGGCSIVWGAQEAIALWPWRDTTCGTAGRPSHPPRLRVRLSPDLAGTTLVGTENRVSVARLFLWYTHKHKGDKLLIIRRNYNISKEVHLHEFDKFEEGNTFFSTSLSRQERFCKQVYRNFGCKKLISFFFFGKKKSNNNNNNNC